MLGGSGTALCVPTATGRCRRRRSTSSTYARPGRQPGLCTFRTCGRQRAWCRLLLSWTAGPHASRCAASCRKSAWCPLLHPPPQRRGRAPQGPQICAWGEFGQGLDHVWYMVHADPCLCGGGATMPPHPWADTAPLLRKAEDDVRAELQVLARRAAAGPPPPQAPPASPDPSGLPPEPPGAPHPRPVQPRPDLDLDVGLGAPPVLGAASGPPLGLAPAPPLAPDPTSGPPQGVAPASVPDPTSGPSLGVALACRWSPYGVHLGCEVDPPGGGDWGHLPLPAAECISWRGPDSSASGSRVGVGGGGVSKGRPLSLSSLCPTGRANEAHPAPASVGTGHASWSPACTRFGEGSWWGSGREPSPPPGQVHRTLRTPCTPWSLGLMGGCAPWAGAGRVGPPAPIWARRRGGRGGGTMRRWFGPHHVCVCVCG